MLQAWEAPGGFARPVIGGAGVVLARAVHGLDDGAALDRDGARLVEVVMDRGYALPASQAKRQLLVVEVRTCL